MGFYVTNLAGQQRDLQLYVESEPHRGVNFCQQKYNPLTPWWNERESNPRLSGKERARSPLSHQAAIGYMCNPTIAYLNSAKNVFRYLKGTKHYSLKVNKSDHNLSLIGYSDSDWAGSEDRVSISGYAFHLNESGPLISYKAKKHNIVALSSCKAEYVAMTAAIQEAKFLSRLLADMTCTVNIPVNLFVDN